MRILKYRLEYFLVWILDRLLHMPPRSWALCFGDGLGALLSHLMVKRARLVIENLAKSFPEKSLDEIASIAGKFWRHLGRTAVEFVLMDDIPKEKLTDWVRIEGEDIITSAVAENKGLIIIGFHFANWELAGIVTQFVTGNVVAIARPMKNPYVENWVQSKRKATGMQIMLHREAVRASLKILRAKKTVGILVDQNLYTGGVFVDFFGRPAATTTLPALLHDRTGAPLVVVHTLRDGNRYRYIATEKVQLPEIGDQEKKILTHTQLINDAIERVIRKSPENWFWIHNRWKRKQ